MNLEVTSNLVINKELIVCPTCNCTGKIKKDECVSYHNNDWDNWNEICSKCNGDGRLVKVEYYADQLLKYNHASKISFVLLTTEFEKLNGRTTKDIYKIGRNNG